MIEHESRPNGPRRLERSRDDRAVAGVCAGVARYLAVDATVVRVITVALLAFGGFGAFLYLAAWLLVPEQGAERPLLGPVDQRRAVQVTAIVVLAIACVALLGSWWGGGFWFGGGPLFLVVCAAAVLWFVSERRRDDEPASAYMASATATAPAPAGTGAPAPGGFGGGASGGDSGDGGDDETLVQPPAGDPRPPRRRGSWGLTAIAVGGVMLALGAAAALDAAGLFDLGWGGFVALSVVLTGVALVVSAFYGGARLLIPVGLLLALCLGSAAAAGISLSGGVGERVYRVSDGDDLRGRYDLGVGHLQLDLRDIELARGVTHVRAELGVGLIEVVAPDGRFDGDDVTVSQRADDGRGDGGIDTTKTIVIGGGERRLEIEAHVGAGVIAITTHPGAQGDWDWASRCGGGARPGLAFAGLRPTCEGDRDEA
ncbi:PspC domain-containing protein [Conexibacter sp. JD483]|uniref:PspC domain-containing protein n=1 Tax=unclassified Conexibacter TaxID=2627773 RepID=UPI0027212A11|nr:MULTISPECIES: PspC domain-containing protein [unclassified Conexibacter]MDO8186177.1 PspC domain-containing protein [Conexibacter sp. CPCC 205706]MDO8199667.1 PspC domain-containing protein [Conexibacter sp. CPCC 205762]MDR9371783.1 PspC domain-containing protein [Conexibacter sp. JD483]